MISSSGGRRTPAQIAAAEQVGRDENEGENAIDQG